MAFDLVARLRLKDELSAGLRKAAGDGDKLRKKLDDVSSATTRMDRTASSVGSAFGRLGSAGARALGGIGSAARGVLGAVTSLKGVILASGAAYTAVIKPLQLASDAEQANIAFTTMLGSAAKAKTFLSDLSDFANKTPFELPQLRDSSKRLLAFGFASKQIIPMMTGIGNAASGLGLGADGIDRITLALGQIKAKGRLQGDEAMQLTEAGIPVWDILAKKMKLTTAQVIKLSEKGIIPADKAIKVLVDGMNQRFPNMMDKQSKSLAGLWSTIKDTFSSKILTEWGNGLAAGIAPKLEKLTTWIDNNGTSIDRWGVRLQNAASTASTWITTKLESAFKYVKGLIENPSFKNLTFGDKIKFIFEDAKSAFDRWMDNGGRQQIVNAAGSFTSMLSSAIGENGPAFTAMGIDIGRKIGGGIRQGVKEAMPSWMLKTMDVMTPQYVQDFWDNVFKSPEPPKPVTPPAGLTLKSFTPPNSNTFQPRQLQVPTKHAGGLDRVPYNGYPAILHKDERVQTKAEADTTRNGNTSRTGALITGNTFIVRQESDIEAIALQLVRMLQQSEGARVYG